MSDTPPVCDYEGSDYRTRFWEQGGRTYEDAVERIALQRLLPPRAARQGRLLELGAGFGRLSPEYAGYSEVVLVDYSRTLLQEARARLGDGGGDQPRYTYVAANIYSLPFVQGRFNAAAMVRVLHHFADVPAALAQIRHTLAPDACFLLEFASKRHLKAIARWLLRRQDWNPFTPEPVEFAALNFDFDPDWLAARLSDAGFAIERRLALSYFRVGALKRALPLDLLTRLDSAAQLTAALGTLSPSVLLRCHACPDPTRDTGAPANAAPHGFRCPACRVPLPALAGDAFTCPECARVWVYRDGVYDFRAAQE